MALRSYTRFVRWSASRHLAAWVRRMAALAANTRPPPFFCRSINCQERYSASTSRSEERRVGEAWRSWRDWSSDVCSSDLGGLGQEDGGFGREHPAAALLLPVDQLPGAVQRLDLQIGRAACRGSVEILA